MNNIILDELELNFNSIEKEIFEVVCKIGLSRIKVILENVDNLIFESRDTKRYRYKFKTDEKIKEELQEVYSYYKSNFNALTRYQDRSEDDRREINLFLTAKGKEISQKST
ncbi:UPF0236 family transposase-like protein [Clostridium sp. BJN0013]|uniref:UPF0236 family transposase-like protein n=1 Tax=Clostridium sp. BJN0013 TaxID=3236840 RepID=UPI0034C650C7